MATHYDLIAIGSGEAGKFIPWTYATTQNKKCAVIERSMYGGSCPNVACLPSKNFLYSAKIAHLVQKHGKAFGLSGGGEEKIDMMKVSERKNQMIETLHGQFRHIYGETDVEFIWGDAKFVGKKEIEVNGKDGEKRIFTADKIVVNTGSRARVADDVPGLKEAKPMTHVEILDLDHVPEHLIILGGGYVGLEFAQAFRRFGAKVYVVERNERIIKNEDEDVSGHIKEVLDAEGVSFFFSTKVEKVAGTSGQEVSLHCSKNGESFTIDGTHILAATGRIPNTQDIGLDTAGVKVNSRGFITVDEHNRTTADDVFAVGDCAGSPLFTHIGMDDFRIVRDVLDGKADLSTNRRSTRQVPFTLFTDPELAHIGLRERDAKAKRIKYRISKVSMGDFLRSLTMEEGSSDGFAKVLVSEEDDTILGFTAVGPEAGEMLPVVQLAMKKGLAYTEISELVITHPTMVEGLVMLFMGVPAKK